MDFADIAVEREQLHNARVAITAPCEEKLCN